jgi:hypothetical protein
MVLARNEKISFETVVTKASIKAFKEVYPFQLYPNFRDFSGSQVIPPRHSMKFTFGFNGIGNLLNVVERFTVSDVNRVLIAVICICNNLPCSAVKENLILRH